MSGYFHEPDQWAELLERFHMRGATIRPGNITVDMLKHLLDSQEETEATLKGVEDKLRKLRSELGD